MTDTTAAKPTKNGLTEIGREAMRKALLEALARHNWNVTRAAREFSMDSQNLHRAIRNLGVLSEFKAARDRSRAVDSDTI